MLKKKKLNCDLCVIGGGMSGICASIAAARKGLKVVLMHERPVLGGNASSEIRMWICGSHGINNRETGIIEEIMLESLYKNPTKNYYIWDSLLYDFIWKEKNITLLLNCTCLDAECENGDFPHKRTSKIKSVTGYQLTTQTYINVCSKYFADCSGDSITVPLTNAEYMLGREDKTVFNEETSIEKSDKKTMGMSCLIEGRETNDDIKYIPPEYAAKLTKENFNDRYLDIYNEGENYWYLELGGNKDSIHDTDEISKDLFSLAAGTWDYIKNSKEQNADKWELEFMGYVPGKRESRRMKGEYILTQRDITDGKKFDDAVAYGGWPLDDHFPDGFYHKGVPNTYFKTEYPFHIPYRCLYSSNIDNLFFAGRNISTSHLALSSTRVMATCSILGQAVGTAAALANKYNMTPHDIYLKKIRELQLTLMNDDCFIPNFSRDISEKCKKTATDAALCDGYDRVNDIYNNNTCGISCKNSNAIKYVFDEYISVNSIHIVFNSDLNRETLPGGHMERTHSTRSNILLSSPQMHMPDTLCKSFTLKIITESGSKTVLKIDNNRKRSYNVKINEKIKEIALIPESNWGNSEYTDVFSFDFE